MSSPYVNSVQTGSITIASGASTGTYTLPTTVGALAFVLYQGETTSDTSGSAKNNLATVVLTNTTTLTVNRSIGTLGTLTVYFTVIDATAALVQSVQTGTITTASNTGTATIASVDTTRSVTFLNNANTTSTSSNVSNWLTSLALTSATLLTATNAGGGVTVAYTVVQFQASVIHSLQALSFSHNNSTTFDATAISSVIIANTLLVYQGTSATSNIPYATLMQTIALDATSAPTSISVINTRTVANTGLKTTNLTVVEFVPGVITSVAGTISIPSGQSATATVAVDPTIGFLNYNGQQNQLTTYQSANGQAAITLTNSTTATALINSTNGAPILGYQAVVFGPGPTMTGTAVAASAATGTVRGSGQLSGASAAASVASGTMGGSGSLAGTSAAASTALGNATAFAAVSGEADAVSGATGAIGGIAAAAGSAAALSGSSATLSGSGAISGAASAVSGVSGAMTGAAALAATSAASAGASGTMTGRGALSGSTIAASSATGGLVNGVSMSGNAAAVSTAAGTLTSRALVTGTSAAASGATATLTGIASVAGTAVAQSGAAGSLFGKGALSGASSATSGATGAVNGFVAVSGVAAAASGSSGTLRGLAFAAGSAAAQSNTIAVLRGLGALAAVASAASGAAGTLSATGLFAFCNALSSATGTISVALPPPVFVNLTIKESDVLTSLRAFLLQILPSGTQVVRGQSNRVAMPRDPFVTMTVVGRDRLSTNIDAWNYAPGARMLSVRQSTRLDVQIDCYGTAATDNVQIVMMLFRDQFAASALAFGGFAIAPLYTSAPRNLSFPSGENQYEDRWSIDLSVEYDPVVTVAQDFAQTVTAASIGVEATYPP